jgi:uncharacterized membrane protein
LKPALDNSAGFAMNSKTLLLPKSSLWMLAALVAASVFAVSLFVVRVLHSGYLTHGYFIWNLFLAWMPVVFALLAHRFKHSLRALLLCGSLWLLFLPNAPYIITDLVHLRARPPVPYWYDMVLFQCFIGLGVLLGFVSLYWMQQIVLERIGPLSSWFFVIMVIGLTGFGIYLGRFQRWNSWDMLLNPFELIGDILRHFHPPRRRVAGLYSILYAAFFFATYVILYALTHFRTDPIRNLQDEHAN